MLGSGECNDPQASRPRVLDIISRVLERLVVRNEGLARQNGLLLGNRLSAFHGVRAPGISIAHYLERIYKYTNCSPSCFVVAFVYIDRLAHRHPHSLLLSLNVHRLLLTTLMLAAKLLDDAHYNNAFYARVGGVSNAELNRLELELLSLLDFGVVVSCGVFQSYCVYLEKETLLNGQAPTIDRPLPLPHHDFGEISVNHRDGSPPHHDLGEISVNHRDGSPPHLSYP